MKKRIFLLLPPVLLAFDCTYSAGAQSADAITANQPDSTGQLSFSAHYVFKHQPSNTILDEARVLYGDAGLRVEQLLDHSTNVFIANYAEDRFWFVDRQRQLVHAVPVIVTEHESAASGLAMKAHSAGVIKLSPCEGLTGKPGAMQSWQGRSVQHWTCLIQGKPAEEQWYAPEPGVVVRSLDTDGFLSELTDIRLRVTSSQNFQPPSDYRSVGIEELMNPAVAIDSYVE